MCPCLCVCEAVCSSSHPCLVCLTGEGESSGDGDLRQRSKCPHE